MTDINKLSKSYIRQELLLTVALCLVAFIVMNVWFLYELLSPVVVSVAFTLVVSYALGIIWRRVATKSPESLPTFHTAASGFRLLAALATMFVYYLINGRSSMMMFFLVFATFYVVSLAHHSIFFARVANRS